LETEGAPMINEFEQTEKDNLERIILDIIARQKDEPDSLIDRTDVDDENSGGYEMTKLSPRADTTQVINKINEIVNSINKNLRDYRI